MIKKSKAKETYDSETRLRHNTSTSNTSRYVAMFRYLGITLDQTDDYWLAVRRKIIRARLVWGRLGTLLQWEGADPHGGGNVLQGSGTIDITVWFGDVGVSKG